MADPIKIWDSSCLDVGSGPPDALTEEWISSGPGECDFVPPRVMESFGLSLSVTPPCSPVRAMQVPVLTSFQMPSVPSVDVSVTPPVPQIAIGVSVSSSPGGSTPTPDEEPTGPSGPDSSAPEDDCGSPSMVQVITDLTCAVSASQVGNNINITITLTKVIKTLKLCLIQDPEYSGDTTENTVCAFGIPCECESSGPEEPPPE